MQKRIFIRGALAAAAAATVVLLSGCGQKAEQPFKVGATAGPHAAIVNAAAEVAKKKGLTVQVVEFTDYVTPDKALNDGALDANVYQHEPFLNNFNRQQGSKLVKAADAVVQPMGFYSNSIRSLEAVPTGSRVSIPNDPSNSGRALLLLQASGLIRLKDGVGGNALITDIVDNPKALKIVELEAAQLPRSLPDVDIAVIPMNYVISSGLSAKNQGFYFESLQAPFALMIIASRDNNRNDPRLKTFIDSYRSQEVKAFIEKKFDGSVRASW
ncbi:MAG: MetQ/NlpA family ABC transporter substrate-binding protein [Duodenibacillus sp.]|nr:MetQ/NlpA family ABC transporter substrate-binding protein [Duodenibacillus sp.]